MSSHTLFISDLHLQENEPTTVNAFIRFMGHEAMSADALYILGDLFDAWIGDDDHRPFNQQMIRVLRQLAATGKPVYFMRGNRDFLMGSTFAQEAGITLLRDPTVISLYGRPTVLTHGDVLCTRDTKHQAYRKKTLNPFLRHLFLMIPLSMRRKIAAQVRKKSQQHNLNTPSDITDVAPEAVMRMLTQYRVDLLIHGHTHQPNIHLVNVRNFTAQRIVLDAWHSAANALVYRQDGSFELIRYPT
ncbi:MAG: UDP-2,3-diacylglucosamine diphosphatase [Coxiella sp. RIFCSPHIGHO2_12_FULL_44_14]|nr:MAG: UDP-2,3-diacylglucosamine diphosphatase [Coxiella sp. RIFCSPHIGHO2_12_FULL_44_14]